MTHKKFVVIMIFVICSLSIYTFAENAEADHSTAAPDTTQDQEFSVDGEVDALFDAILDPENQELEEKMEKVLEEHEDHAIVVFFRNILQAFQRFLDKVFEFASKAATVGVD